MLHVPQQWQGQVHSGVEKGFAREVTWKLGLEAHTGVGQASGKGHWWQREQQEQTH